jgi:hypothetical protein
MLSIRKKRMRRGLPRPGRVKGHPEAAPKWPMVCLLVQGFSYDEMAKQNGRTKMTIHKDLRGLGFSGPGRNAGGNPVYSFGERINGVMVASLVRCLGLHPKTLAARLGTAKGTVDHYIYSRQPRHVATKIARNISDLRNELINHLVSTTQENPQDRYGAHRALATFWPDLRERSSLLVKIIYQCRKFLQQRPNATREELGEWLCAQAQAEASGRLQGRFFSAFLPWAPEVLSALDFDQLKSLTARHIIAHQLIATRWRTTDTAVRAAFNAKPIPPAEMRRLFENYNVSAGGHPVSPAKKPSKVGRPSKAELFRSAIMLNDGGLNWPQCADKLIPEEAKENRHAAAEKLRVGVARLKRKDKGLPVQNSA